MAALLEARTLRKAFGPVPALRGVDLALSPGETVALFGANGAGKTTLVRCLAALCRPDSGMVLVGGENLAGAASGRLRARIGYVGHQTLLYDALSAEENLLFYAGLYGLPDPARRARALLEEFGLAPRARDAVRGFSRGMQQRLSLARAFLHEPAALLLDEPATGLDPSAAAVLDGRLAGFRAAGGATLLVSHDIPAALALADRFAVLKGGRIADGGPAADTSAARLRAEHYPAPREASCGVAS